MNGSYSPQLYSPWFLTVKQKILFILLEKGALQNSEIAKKASITEQWCSQAINALHAEGLIESELKPPRKLNKPTKKSIKIVKSLFQDFLSRKVTRRLKAEPLLGVGSQMRSPAPTATSETS
ncbi:MAG: winged helix-turn-helix transcriptional regulator [Candidatus Bathyarchaeia archaeon]